MPTLNECIIFLGPSLPLTIARLLLPNALFLPPARCGDMVRALRLQPRIIGIIDGLFEQAPPIWHKEILLALEEGITVFGASSMGALRAAELAEYGMIGIGKIFHDYHTGILNDDDEVAILHSAAPEFKPMTDAMVNIRATLQQAVIENIIHINTENELCIIAKNLFYRERTLDKTLNIAEKNTFDKQELSYFKQWLMSGKYVDLKQRDAEQLLHHINNLSSKLLPSTKKNFVNQSLHLKTLQKNISCRPLENYSKNLPIVESVLLKAKEIDHSYPSLQRLAYLLSAVDTLTSSKKIPLIEDLKIENDDLGLVRMTTNPSWDIEHDCSIKQKEAFFNRVRRFQFLIDTEKKETLNFPSRIEYYLLSLMRLMGIYTVYQTPDSNLIRNYFRSNPVSFSISQKIAILWWVFDSYVNRLPQQISNHYIQYYSDTFRRHCNLLPIETLQQWMIAHDLSETEYTHLMLLAARFRFLVFENNLHAIGLLDHQPTTNWLLDALYLTNNYQSTKQLIVTLQ